MPRRLSRASAPGTTAASLPATLESLPPSLRDPTLPLPKLIIFDLDYTLWPFWVDCHVSPPLKPTSSQNPSSATDRLGESFAFYPDVAPILHALPHLGTAHRPKLAVASRTSAPSLARDLLKLLHLPLGAESRQRRALDAFDGGTEIYPGSKVRHMEALQRRTGVAYEDMLFFDDETRNRDTETLGVTMHLVSEGVSWGAVADGIQEWRRRRGHGDGQQQEQ
ncbi:unnamed protein product [Clonostachys rhizophaga]|uniref:Uncharacterized protein n=1 Tax=Clonostachys rhizophaga TaxID=160324 RepID=A0A9N9VMA5_9HYPO|nr:unnamed protein product [Clonostachys rhizophaga]